MNAPGIRHTKACQQKRAVIEGGPAVFHQPDTPQHGDDQKKAYQGVKRPNDTSLEKLEEEIKSDEPTPMTLDSIGLCWADTCEPLRGLILDDVSSLVTSATSPEIFDEFVMSIRFDSSKTAISEKVQLCDQEVMLWKPTEAVDDTSLTPLNPELTFEGMKEELANMTKCDVGSVLSGSDVEKIRASDKGARVIQARWVTAYKHETRVRARVVAKDIRDKQSARSLGFSSPTPSAEVLNVVLSMSATRRWRLRALDISHAFMHSPLPSGVRVILKMPQSISNLAGEPIFLDPKRSLNGLRDASLHWLHLLATMIASVGLWNEELEPCCQQGLVFSKGRCLGSVVLIAYVDDILICSSTREAEETVVQAIARVVPTKTTGQILVGKQGGGSLQFIGRIIERQPGEDAIFVSVSSTYLDSTFEDFQISKGSTSVPNVASFLEKNDEASQRPLSPEAYTRFRKALGRLLWLSQVRMDIKVWLSLLGSQQAHPVCATENALRSVLRFLKADSLIVLRMPTRSDLLIYDSSKIEVFLHLFCDASHAPYRFNKRKGISGQAVFFEKSLTRGISKQQQATSLSSCESELYSMQQTAQDAVALSKIVQRLLHGIGECGKEPVSQMLLESDSSSAIQLVNGLDLPRRSRHIEIRLLWLRGQISSGKINLKHHPGLTNMSDIFTKCLGTHLFNKHRSALGFEPREFPKESLSLVFGEGLNDNFVNGIQGQKDIALVEVCCEPNSCLCVETSKGGIPYVGVVHDMQSKEVLKQVSDVVKSWKKRGLWIHVHASTPCSSGSPLKRFSQDTVTVADAEWESIMSAIGDYFGFGDSLSFELPFFNDIWNRDLTKKVLLDFCLSHGCQVFLSQTGMKNEKDEPIGKSLGFATTHFSFAKVLHGRFGFCNCSFHASLSDVNFSSTARYNERLAKSVLLGVKASTRDP